MKVLVVEDYGPIRIALRDRLTEDGCLVDEASDGEAAFKHICETAYSVIVLDLMLPDTSGFEILKTVRQQNLDTAVMVITARDRISDRVAGLDMGADDYLVKPFAIEEAAARIRALIRRRFNTQTSVIKIEDLEVDIPGGVARRLGMNLNLTAREFALLEFLAYRKGRIVRRSEIWEEIYESDREESASNVVTVVMSRLRKKIDLPDKKPLIHTCRGLGYSLASRDPSA
jgi:DNA-binding response OmpR family regulator